MKQKSKGQLKQLKHFSMKIQEFTSNVVITEKNEKQYVRVQLSIPGTQGNFQVKLPLILMVLLMAKVVQCAVKL